MIRHLLKLFRTIANTRCSPSRGQRGGPALASTVLIGDALRMLQTLPDGSVQMCVTSPPYYGLRYYGRDAQIGLEETPELYVSKLVAVARVA